MCEKCRQLEQKIEHCRKFVMQGFNKLTADRINELIRDLQRQKAQMHEGLLVAIRRSK
jgi:hypothetical protein